MIFDFQLTPLSVSYLNGKLLLKRPGPPAAPKAPTLAELLRRREEMSKRNCEIVRNNRGERVDLLEIDAEIARLAEASEE